MKLCTKLVGEKISAKGILAALTAISPGLAVQASVSSITTSSSSTQPSTATLSSARDTSHNMEPSPVQVPQTAVASQKVERCFEVSPEGRSVSQPNGSGFKSPASRSCDTTSFLSAGVPAVKQGAGGVSSHSQGDSQGADNGQYHSPVSSGAWRSPKASSVSQGSVGPPESTRISAAVEGSGIFDPPPKTTDGKDVTRKFPKGIGHFW